MTGDSGFAGIYQCQFTCGEPPDPWVAVGPNDVVQAVNLRMHVSTRAGVVRKSSSLAAFFLEPAGQLGDSDPHVRWDQTHQRWLANALSWDSSVGHLYLAVSDGTDPAAGWTIYRFDFAGSLPDYPALGITSDKVMFSANLFPLAAVAGACGGGYDGAELLVVDWADLVVAASSLTYIYTLPNCSLFTWRPAANLSSSSTGFAIVETGAGHVGYATITGTVAAGVTLSAVTDLTAAGVPAFTTPPIPAGALTFSAKTVDGRPTDALWQNGGLWFVSTYPCVPTGDVVIHDCVRATQISTSGPPSVAQDFVVGVAGQDDFMGGIGLSTNGTMFLVYSSSSSTSPISTYAAAQAPTDGPYTLRQPVLVRQGLATYTSSYGRWGDYVGVAFDPSEPWAVWQADEYPNDAGSWSTWVSRLVLDTTPPTGTVAINDGATSTTSAVVSLAIPATDALSGMAFVRIVNGSGHVNGGGQLDAPGAMSFSWAPTLPWSLAVGDGAKTVFVQFADTAGNWSTPISAAITLDTTPPVGGTVAIAGGATSTAVTPVSVNDPATDVTTGVAYVRLSNDATTDSSGNLVNGTTYSWADPIGWSLAAGDPGLRNVYIQWRDAAGNWSGVSSDPDGITYAPADTVPPTSSGPVVSRFFAPTTMTPSEIPLAVSWPAATDVGSGVAFYRLQVSKDGGPYGTVMAGAPTSAVISVVPRHVYRFRFAAVDGSGNASADQYTPYLFPTAYQENNRSIVYHGSWRFVTTAAAYGGHKRYATVSGASATLRFTGRSVAWITSKQRSSGVAKVYIGRRLVAIVNLNSRAGSGRFVAFARSWSVSGIHTLKIVVSGTRGHPRVDLDALIVLR